MQNFVERIARHADIDTRRAMGFKPRRLVIPSLNIMIPEEHKGGHVFSVKFDSGIEWLCWPYKWLDYGIEWIINGNTTCSLFTKNGSIEITKNRWKVKSETYTHPDFNEDGSFKRTLKIRQPYITCKILSNASHIMQTLTRGVPWI